MPGRTKTAATPQSPSVSPMQSTHAESLRDCNSFGIPESQTFLLSILAEVRKLTDGSGIVIEDVVHNLWQEAYHFKRGAEFARMNIGYDSKNKVSSIAPQGLGDLHSALATLLSPLKGRPLVASATPAVSGGSFPKQFLNDFHEKLLGLCSACGITIQNVVEQQWSLRYSFTKNGAVAVYNVFYDRGDQFTKCQPVLTACSPGPLASEVEYLLTNGMRG